MLILKNKIRSVTNLKPSLFWILVLSLPVQLFFWSVILYQYYFLVDVCILHLKACTYVLTSYYLHLHCYCLYHCLLSRISGEEISSPSKNICANYTYSISFSCNNIALVLPLQIYQHSNFLYQHPYQIFLLNNYVTILQISCNKIQQK